MKTPGMLDRFVRDVTWMFGTQVKSIMLFGSTVSGEWHARHSDHNLLIVLNRITQEELSKFSTILPGWIEAGNPAPMLMTPEELERGADVFPMEYLDFKAHHRILHGANLVQNLQVSRTNLRHECEHELRGKLMKFRQAYAATADRAEDVRDLLIKSWSTFAVIGKSVLHLAEQPVPSLKMEIYEALAKLTGGDLEVFRLIQTLRQDPWATINKSWADLTHQYLTELEKIVDHIDRIGLKREEPNTVGVHK